MIVVVWRIFVKKNTIVELKRGTYFNKTAILDYLACSFKIEDAC